MARICMVGTGYVGLVSGACFADFGHEVACVDIDISRVDDLRDGVIPFYEPGLGTLVRRNREGKRLRFTADLADGLRGVDVVMIAVQTPSAHSGAADVSHVLAVAEQVAAHLEGGEETRIVVTKSTVPVGTSHRVAAVLAKAAPQASFEVASNPEFLREGSAIEDFMRPDRVVLGVESKEAEERLRALYRPLYLLETPIVVTDIVTAELVKYAANAFLAVKIGYINEMADLCESFGADVGVVARAMGLDGRIGPKFLHAGLGYGGSCLPKDTRAVVHMAREQGLRSRLVESAIEVNDGRVGQAVGKLERLLGGSSDTAGSALENRTVALLGLSFKPNTDDVREAPSLALIEQLRSRGARVRGHDPAAGGRILDEVPDLELHPDPYACVEDADACVLVTEWNPFRELDLERLRAAMAEPVFLDCRNVYRREQMERLGFRYDCFGR